MSKDFKIVRSIVLQEPMIKSSSIMLLNGAPSSVEAERGVPFAGLEGDTVFSLLAESGIDVRSCVQTAVFHVRPERDEIMNFFTEEKEKADPAMLGYPFRGKLYMRAEYGIEMKRLFGELRRWKPSVIVCFGATACWAMFGRCDVSNLIGKPQTVQTHICMPIYHPAILLSNGGLGRESALAALKTVKDFSSVEIP